ncbi:FecR domain-containing protein [Danxiaibacter flavus]|uniref:FecR domain-containing protein n=1 Tax=Danxiaibacter flavus TaxID=3049108 RepID=A0ABV3ZP74_9BACT|nr:FecR domain-containing protein [Chitinophagaceae bacterium DXS]
MATDPNILHRLYIEKLAGTISQEEEAWLKDRLETDPESKQIWEQLEREGEDMNIQGFLDQLHPEEELEQLKRSMLSHPVRKPRVRRLVTLAAAAAVLILLVATAKWMFFTDRKITDNRAIASLIKEKKGTVHLRLATGNDIDLKDKAQGEQLKLGNTTLNLDSNKLGFSSTDTAFNLLSIPQGETYTINLSDGTSITLNADSKLRFPFKFVNATREVYLEGEAFFKVAKDSRHPFIVHTPLTNVEVLGTQFNVNTYQKGTVATALVEGKVRTGIPGGDKQQELAPGQAAIFNASKGFNIENFDTDDVTSWLNGIYYFHDLSFHELAESISRIYGVTISFDDPLIEKKSVSGVMDKNNFPELLQDLKSTVGIKYYYAGNTLHFY